MNNEHQTGEVVETVPLRPRTTTTRPVSGAARPGDRLGRYSVLEFLGKGGMGEVYTAYDPKLDRRVALKVIHSRVRIGDGYEEAQATLLKEARTLARISHPNVIAVYDADTLGDDVYVTMELVEGTNVRQWLEDKSPSREEILAVFRAAAAGLAAAHDAGLVHRDVKPENLLIGDDGRVRLIDFGIAQLASRSAPRKSEDGPPAVIGTPAYMAPEQSAGGPADARSDQYSLCVALLEALTGKRPERGKDDSVRNGANGVPSWLERAIDRGLQESAGDRYKTMHELAAAITPPPSKRRLLALGLGGVAIAGVAFLAASVAPNSEDRNSVCESAATEVRQIWSPQAREAVTTAFATADSALGRASFEKTAARIDDYTAEWSRARVAACREITAGGLSADAGDTRIACLGQRLGELKAVVAVLSVSDSSLVDNALRTVTAMSPVSRCANLTSSSGEVALTPEIETGLAELKALERSGRYKQGIAAAESLISKAIAEKSPAGHARALAWRGRLESHLDQLKAAEDTLFESARLAELAGDNYTRAESWAYLVWVVGVAQRRRHDGLRFSKQAEVAIRNAGSPLDLESKRIYHEGMVLRGLQRYRESLKSFERSSMLAEKAWGSESWERMLSRMGLAMTLRDLERLEEAATIYDEVLVTMISELGADNPRLAVLHGNIAKVLAALRRYSESREHYVRSRELKVKKLGPEHPSIQITDHNMAILEERLGDYEAAEAALRQVHEARVKRDGENYRKLAMSLESRGRIAQKRGHLDRAAELQRASIAAYAEKGPDAREDVAYARASRCDTLRLDGRLREAARECEEAVSMLEEEAADPRNLAYALTAAAHLDLERSRTASARKRIDRAHAIRAEHKSDAADRVRTRYVLAAAMRKNSSELPAALKLAKELASEIETLHIGNQQLREPTRALIQELTDSRTP